MTRSLKDGGAVSRGTQEQGRRLDSGDGKHARPRDIRARAVVLANHADARSSMNRASRGTAAADEVTSLVDASALTHVAELP
jgi:hypothetical protein